MHPAFCGVVVKPCEGCDFACDSSQWTCPRLAGFLSFLSFRGEFDHCPYHCDCCLPFDALRRLIRR
jgi:hypothetical protein